MNNIHKKQLQQETKSKNIKRTNSKYVFYWEKVITHKKILEASLGLQRKPPISQKN